MLARTIMVQGTTSSAGKSLLVTALCRLFMQRGLRVAPFKSQNMSLNSYVTPDGREIGRAQAVQAEACGLECSVDMNPVLLKPEGHARSQVVVLGKPALSMSAREYEDHRPELGHVVKESLERLRRKYEFVVIEGAGSPVEINLRHNEIVNMFVAHAANAPVLLIGDIDRGGVFAAFVGTMELLEPHERERVRGFVINKFRGDIKLLRPGIEWLENRYGIPVVGVIPFIPRLRIADEDSVSLDDRMNSKKNDDAGAAGRNGIDIAVIRLPRISNYDDYLPLEFEPGVTLRFVDDVTKLGVPDLLIIPGSKSTVADLQWLRKNGFEEPIKARVENLKPILGVCGGCQMLGERIEDPYGVESVLENVSGLGLLPVHTRFEQRKMTAQVTARVAGSCFMNFGQENTEPVDFDAYEIHMGLIELIGHASFPFHITSRSGDGLHIADGAIGHNGYVVGTMLHGIFENDSVRAALLGFLRKEKGITAPTGLVEFSKDAEYDRLALIVAEHMDIDAVFAM